MIPLRVCLEGFLCYREAQEFSFDGARLWLLTGPNGSGKSALFDAITYALFHHHRGGTQNAEELIHKHSDRLRIEFDFLLEGRTYRVIRTLRRRTSGTTSSQEIQVREETGPDGPRWVTIPNTTQRRHFDTWIREHIGLTYETFTSSVLLLQNKAEKLLDARPQGRFEVLAGIVDLQRYERLHEQARERCRQWEDRIKRLRGQLDTLPEITPLVLEEAKEEIRQAQEAYQQAETERKRLEDLLVRAQRWEDLQRAREQVEQQLRKARNLLQQAQDLERDWKRFQELKTVLPQIKLYLQQRQCFEELQYQVQDYQNKLRQLEEELRQAQCCLEAIRQQHDQLEKTLAHQRQQKDQLTEELHRLEVQCRHLEEYEQQRSKYRELQQQLAALPADLEHRIQKDREEVERLQKLRQEVLPTLEHLAKVWHEWKQSSEEEQAALQVVQELESQLQKQAGQEAHLRQEWEVGQQRLRQLQEQAAAAHARWQEAQKSLEEIEQLRGAITCHACGQPLTPQHLAQERQRRQQQAATAEQSWRTCHLDCQQAEQQVTEQQRQLDKLVQHLDRQRQQLQEERRLVDQARYRKQRLQTEWQNLRERLPPEWQQRLVADLIALFPPSLPTADEERALRQQADMLPVVQQRLREEEKSQQHQRQLQAQQEYLRQQLQRLEEKLPPDYTDLRQKYIDLKSRHSALLTQLGANEQTVKRVRQNLEQKQQYLESLRHQQAQLQAALKEKQESQRQHQRLSGSMLKQLPADWQPLVERAGLTDCYNWEQEYDHLREKQIETRYQQLETARQNRAELERHQQELMAQQEEIPVEARRPAQAVASEHKAALLHWQNCDRRWQESQRRWEQFQALREERNKLQEELDQAELQHKRWRLLAELLGRERLQLYLVRQAERQIVSYANAVLDRLSGGEMALRLAGEAGGEGESSKAFQLEVYHRQWQDRPITIPFLSGSQRFRVAVSLALGIGQYASRQRRPLEAVIIDEGFGCLDRENRQVMIRELQNLSQYLRCILLVSHQEEFATAFADGYHISLNSGTPQVHRLHR